MPEMDPNLQAALGETERLIIKQKVELLEAAANAAANAIDMGGLGAFGEQVCAVYGKSSSSIQYGVCICRLDGNGVQERRTARNAFVFSLTRKWTFLLSLFTTSSLLSSLLSCLPGQRILYLHGRRRSRQTQVYSKGNLRLLWIYGTLLLPSQSRPQVAFVWTRSFHFRWTHVHGT